MKTAQKYFLITLVCISFLTYGKLHAQLNKSLIKTLDSISEGDQRYRGKIVEDAAKEFGWESPQVREIWRKQELLDSEMLTRTEQVLNKYGYPGRTMVGTERKSIAFLVIQHASLEVREKYIDLLTRAANQGELLWSSLALMIDRNLTDRNQPQVYGSQMRQIGKSIQLFPIVDEPEVDKRRAEIGLPPLASYLKSFGIDYVLPTKAANLNPKALYVDFSATEKSPVELIGGQKKLYEQLKYPKQAMEKGISGKVVLELTIDATGKPKDISVAKSLGYGCDEEAIRVIKDARFTNSSGAEHTIRMSFTFPYVD
jgi:TonB family protein